MTPRPTHRRTAPRRRRLVVEGLEHRTQPSAALTELPAVEVTTVAGPLPLSVVDVPLFSRTTTTTAAPVTPVPAATSPVVLGGQYLSGFDVTASYDLVAEPVTPAKALVAVNRAPTATDDRYSTAVNLLVLSTPLTVTGRGVLGNDADPDGDTLAAELVTGPARGLLLFHPDGTFTYTAVLNFAGTDSFTYRVTDGTTWSAAATVTINVGAANRTPVAGGDTYSTPEDTLLTIAAPGLLGNDTDPDGDTLAVVVGTSPRHGTLVLDAGGGFRYTPDADWSGTDSFTYRATDGSRSSALVTVTLVVTPVDDPPTLDPLPDLTIAEDSAPLTLTLRGISAGGGERQHLDVFAGRSDPTLLAQPTGFFNTGTGVGTLVVRPVPDAHGTATVTLVVDDGTSSITRTFVVTVSPVNDAPDAADDVFATSQNTPVTVTAGVLGNDGDIDGDALTAVLVAVPANGSLTLNPDGTFTYAPDPAFTGTDRFTYRASDGSAVSRLATVEFRVLPASGRPVAEDDSYTVVGDQVLTIPAAGVLANDTRSGTAPLTAALVSGPSNGTSTLNADGSFTYTPAAGFVGLDSFNYKAADAGGETGTARVTVLVRRPNRAPTGGADAVATVTGQPVILSAAAALANDADPDGDPMTAELVDGAANGIVTVEADGSFTYTPGAGFSGTDTFTYRVTDGELASGLVQVTVTVAAPPAPEPPPTPADPPTPDAPPPTTTPAPTGTAGPTASVPTTAAAPPTTTTAAGTATVSAVPSASGSDDGFGPSGGGPAGTVSPVPAVSSGGATSVPRLNDTAASEAGRVVGTDPAPAAVAPPEVAPPPSSPPQPEPAPAPTPEPPAAVAPPSTPPAAQPAAAFVPPVVSGPAPNVVLPDSLLEPLDRIRDELRAETADRATTDTIVVAGSVAVAGTVLLNTRAVYWFLGALLARPAVWKRFDPLDVVYAWERDGKRPRDAGPDDSLQSMVG